MPYKHGWFLESRIFYNEYWGDVTAEEIRQLAEFNLEYLDHSDAPLVHAFINIEAMGSFPVNLSALRDSTLTTLRHPKMGWLIAYGKNNRFVSFLIPLVTQLFQTRYRLFDTYEEAVAFLQSVDTSLPDLGSPDVPESKEAP